jgi:spore coat polysaccharide biosynthesis protein SpsF
MGSTRLPGKVMKDILGKPLLWHLVYRLRHATLIDKIGIATSRAAEDKAIVKFAAVNSIDCYAGSELDLLDRLYQAARRFGGETVVKIFGDCPLIDPVIVDKVIKYYLDNKDRFDCVSNFKPRTYPQGLDTAVFSFEVIERAWREVTDPFWREWMTRQFFDHPEKYRLGNVSHGEDLSHLRWTVDYEEDLTFVREVFHQLYTEDKIFLMEDVLNLFQRHPELTRINRARIGNDRFQEALYQREGR